MGVKVTMIFGDRRQDIGWSETYQLNAYADVPSFFGTPVAGLLSPLITFMDARRRCLASGKTINTAMFLYRVRCSVVGSFRNSGVYVVPTNGQRGTFTDGNGANVDPVEEWTRLLCDVNVSLGPHGRLFFGGCPETLVSPAQDYIPDPRFWTGPPASTGLLDIFQSRLTVGGWTIHRRTAQTSTASPRTPITSFVVQADNRSVLVGPAEIQAGGVLPPAQGQVIIRGRSPSEWNGTHRYLLIPGTPARLLLGPARQNLADWSGAVQTGSIQLLTNENDRPGLGITPLRFVKRDTGDPFVLYRGRRRRSQG